MKVGVVGKKGTIVLDETAGNATNIKSAGVARPLDQVLYGPQIKQRLQFLQGEDTYVAFSCEHPPVQMCVVFSVKIIQADT